MKEHSIKSSRKLFDLLHDYKNSTAWMFRGQKDASWEILPKAGRKEFALKYQGGVTEKSMFESWKRYAIHFMHATPEDEWDWLALAQHHGLATRLLDWTKSPLNAAFFAVDSNQGQDAAIYAFETLAGEFVSEADPFDVKDLKIYYPRGLSARIISQRGIFTVSGSPTHPIEKQLGARLHKFIIDGSIASDIKQTLEFFGINAMSIYQDLDHLSEYLNSFVQSTHRKPPAPPLPPAKPPFG